MSTGLVNDATQLPAHHQGLAQPLPAHDPNQGTVTPQQAQMGTGEGLPPHMEPDAGNYSALSFEQCIKGVHHHYAAFHRVAAAYEQLRNVLEGKQHAPVISIPTGERDHEGNQIIYELDLNLTLPEGVSEDRRYEVLKRMLGPWNNYLVKEYQRCLTNILKSTSSAVELLNAAQPKPQAPVQASQAAPGTVVQPAPAAPPTPMQ